MCAHASVFMCVRVCVRACERDLEVVGVSKLEGGVFLDGVGFAQGLAFAVTVHLLVVAWGWWGWGGW